jgi:putative proteasome-type protease
MMKDRPRLLYPCYTLIKIAFRAPTWFSHKGGGRVLYLLIGESGYATSLLDRRLRYQTALRTALKVGYLAFEGSRTSTAKTDFPMGVVIYRRVPFQPQEHGYEAAELAEVSHW